jgi:6-phosphogluconate dehydrogenase
VKTVHNGIEYGIMQLIAEAYDLLRRECGLSNAQMAELFETWNKTEGLSSFLIEITAAILKKKDHLSSGDLIDQIKDTAGQKGTGKWTTNAAFDLGIAIPTITAGVDARIVSSAKDFRVAQAKATPLSVLAKRNIKNLEAAIQTALELSIITAYAQGFQLLAAYSQEESVLNLPTIARIWRGGCIIRSALLKEFQQIFAGSQEAAKKVRELFSENAQHAWRSVVALGAERGVPLPAMSASLWYYDAYRTEKLPQNMIQAQRDFFGAHTFERNDRSGSFHEEWQKGGNK